MTSPAADAAAYLEEHGLDQLASAVYLTLAELAHARSVAAPDSSGASASGHVLVLYCEEMHLSSAKDPGLMALIRQACKPVSVRSTL